MEQDLIVERRGKVLLLTLNRPDRLNALSADMNASLQRELQACATDPEVGCVVLTGAGRGFCAGGDVKGMAASGTSTGQTPSLEERIDRQRQGQEVSRLLHTIPKITIAALNGATAGAGLGMALSCDLRYASDRAKLTTAFAKVAFAGDYGVTWGLTSLVGRGKAKELMLLSDVLTAEQANDCGLLNGVFESEQFMQEVMAIAERIANGPLTTYRWMKENVNLAVTQDMHAMLDRESITHLRSGDTQDHKEGVAAFNEKRAPVFKGR
ncbi:MAG: enoyl-CoA hydratase [Gammaproteobacteria bacterium]